MSDQLSRKIETALARAIASGALQPIATTPEYVEEAGVRFIVHVMPNLARKAGTETLAPKSAPVPEAAAARPPKPPFDPFANPEADLVVAPLSDTHTLMLNKFNIIDGHLLVITREFAHQETLLDETDFDALARLMNEVDGIGFYNAGAEAGASQAHKHMQLVPMAAPIEPLLDAAEPLLDAAKGTGILRVPAFGFRHAFARLAPGVWDHPAHSLGVLYRELLAHCGIGAVAGPDGERQSGAYNLLVSRRWMLVVPRTQGNFDTVPVSALCYIGALFVRGEADAARVRAEGPLKVLRGVAPPL